MKYIDKEKIEKLMELNKEPSNEAISIVLEKAKKIKGLTFEETAVLLGASKKSDIDQILQTASHVKQEIYGKRVVLFAPLYLSNICSNYCLYCSFKADNKLLKRKKLSQEEIAEQTIELLKQGHKRVLVVAAEKSEDDVDYFVESINTIYAQRYGKNSIRRININCAPVSPEGFKKLKASDIGTYQIFQETYHDETYKKVHPKGPKSDPDKRLEAVNTAFNAGIDDLGIGVLFGLYDHRFEVLALMMHIKHLEDTFGVGPHTISVPRIEPASGSELSMAVPHPLSDMDFKKIVAVLRLAVPYTGLILSTRETAELRDELFNLGISQISAASRTAPGGYSEPEKEDDTQFSLSDHRTLDEVISSLIGKGALPSFCTACYRKERTGETFMSLAKPGTIKGKCKLNAMLTLKEYLDDFASPEVKSKGYKLLEQVLETLGAEDKAYIEKEFDLLNKGVRDEFI